MTTWVPDASSDVYAFGHGLVYIDHVERVIQPPILRALVCCIKDSCVQTVVKEMTRNQEHRPDMITVVNALNSAGAVLAHRRGSSP